ncbi:MAG: YIP1 family protein [Candidatus Krumholzibacteria bacterium]|nr:YIP1 family protein [Candidatus Krumholzibacteria bacterium]
MEEKIGLDPVGTGDDHGQGVPPVKGGFFASLIDIFLDPQKVFGRIDAGLQWWKAFIVIAVINMAIAWFSMPLQIHITRLNERGVPQERLQQTIDGMERFGWIGAIIAPMAILVVLMLMSGIVNLIVNIVSARCNFRKVLSLACFAGLIGALEQIITIVIIHARGIGEIESRADAVVSIGPLALISDPGQFLTAVLQSLSVFQIWYFIVFTLGIAAIFRISWKKALVPAGTLWILGVMMAFVSQKLSGLG